MLDLLHETSPALTHTLLIAAVLLIVLIRSRWR